MKSYAELKALIEKCGVHEQLGPAGKGYGIEQNPHELATFLVRMQELGVQSVLEIGTGYKAGLARFLAHEMGWKVTTVDINDYGHSFEGIEFIVSNNPRKLSHSYYDLVFIDGDHDYDSVRKDFEAYAPIKAKVMAFHDIMGDRDCEGALRFWWELRVSGLDDLYAISDNPPQRAGIGWIEL